jgi:hypothetical protein
MNKTDEYLYLRYSSCIIRKNLLDGSFTIGRIADSGNVVWDSGESILDLIDEQMPSCVYSEEQAIEYLTAFQPQKAKNKKEQTRPRYHCSSVSAENSRPTVFGNAKAANNPHIRFVGSTVKKTIKIKTKTANASSKRMIRTPKILFKK